MKIVVAFAVGLASLLSNSSPGSASPHRYVGIHVIDADDGFCYIEAPHLHPYRPLKPALLFRTHRARHHFIGDPVPYGYDGPRHSYHGHHPVVIAGIEHYCYLDGPHFHHYAPAPAARFVVKGDIHWYVGDFAPTYKSNIYRRKRTNALYAEFDYPRPIVLVDPPAAYAGVVLSAPRAHVDVVAPDVRAGMTAGINVRLPVFSVEIGTAYHGHVHRDRVKHKYKRRKHKRRKHKRRKHAHRKRSRERDERGRRWKF